MSGKKPVVGFICVHNSCRSQMAEALGWLLAADAFDSVSAGTEQKDRINQDAVRLMKVRYGIDMEADGQRPKLPQDIPPLDILITMGCNVQCPFVPCRHREDWGLDDPTGLGDAAFEHTMSVIESKVRELRERVLSGSV